MIKNYPLHHTFLPSAVEQSVKFHIVKYKILLNKISSLVEQNFFEESEHNYLSFLRNLKSQELIVNGTDFFWSLVHRLDNTINKGEKKEIEKDYIFFLVSAFDSFYKLLPVNSKFSVKNLSDEPVLFPKLGIALPLQYIGSSLSKIDETLIEYTDKELEISGGRSYLIKLNSIPAWFCIKSEQVCGKIKIIYQRNLNLFEGHYYLDCCENIFMGHALKLQLIAAFDKIKETNQALFEKLVDSIDYIIPYGNDAQKIYPNFAIATLKKTIFLSINLLSEPIIHIAECIIHEYGHCELHKVQDTILLTHVETNSLDYYSPWRRDIRPLLGLIHAIYISHELVQFYAYYLENNQSKDIDEKALVRHKIEILTHQIVIAIKQIKKNQLTNFTLKLMEDILTNTQENAEHFSISLNNPPIEIINHMEIWKVVNSSATIVE